jgi:ferrous iron transport protein A
MMPLVMSSPGEEQLIKKVGGREETKKFLESLGFVPGSYVSVVADMNGNLIIKVKDSRVAISKEMAMKIMV